MSYCQQDETITKQIQVLSVEFDFGDDDVDIKEELRLTNEVLSKIFEVTVNADDDEDISEETVEEVTNFTGWCVSSLTWQHYVPGDVKPTIAVVQVSVQVVEVLFDFGFPPENIPMEEQQRTENMVLDKIFRVEVSVEVPVDIDTLEELFTKATIKEVAKLTGWRVAELKCRPYYPSRDSFDNTFKKILKDFFEDPDIEEPSTVFLRCFQAYHDERSLTLENIDAELDELFDRENIPTNFNKAIHNFLLEHTE